MIGRRLARFSVIAIVFAAGVAVCSFVQEWGIVKAQSGRRVYELRTYTSPEGKLGDLQARWQAAFKESQKNGPLQTQVQSVFMDPTDFSQLK